MMKKVPHETQVGGMLSRPNPPTTDRAACMGRESLALNLNLGFLFNTEMSVESLFLIRSPQEEVDVGPIRCDFFGTLEHRLGLFRVSREPKLIGQQEKSRRIGRTSIDHLTKVIELFLK